MVWCGYPQPRTGAPPFRIMDTFWMCVDPMAGYSFDSLVRSKIEERRKEGAGSMKVIGKKALSIDNYVLTI